jgi:Ca2+-binding RTX toxin-like protein
MSSHPAASDETLVNSYTTNNQSDPSITDLADGGWVVSWNGEGPGDDNGVFLQRYAANGHKVGSETLVNSNTTDIQGNSKITELANGGWVVTWDCEVAIGDYDIFQQRFTANGNTVGSETLVNSHTADLQYTPTNTALADGGWVVTWWGAGPGDDDGIFQQRYAENGNAVGPETRVNDYTTSYQEMPATTGLADGGWVVTWHGAGPGESGSGIFQQRYAADGHAVGSETMVNLYPKRAQNFPAITALANGGWVVTWDGFGPRSRFDEGIFQQRYTKNGKAVGDQSHVDSDINGDQRNSDTTAFANGGWVVTWHGEGPGDKSGIFEQRYAANGDKLGTNTLVNSYTTGAQGECVTTTLADGGWVVTWWGEGKGDSPHGIYQRHFGADINGSRHIDKLTGTDGDEYLIGHSGNDRLDGGGGNDILVGGFGRDTYIVNSAGDQVQENEAEGGDRVLASIDYVLPGPVENLVLTGKAALHGTGNIGDNHITGNSGNNTIRGGFGQDTETGGKGDDKLFGGGGADHFVFRGGHGADTIGDFAAKGFDNDVIDFRHVRDLTDFADLKAHHMEQVGSSVVIDYTAHDSVTLKGVEIKDLSGADFVF